MDAQQRYKKVHRSKVNADARKYSCKLRYNYYNKIIPRLKINGCAICGYDKCDAALSFHHVNSSDKNFTISKGYFYSSIKLATEINKCILLCANCHKEIHAKEGAKNTTTCSV